MRNAWFALFCYFKHWLSACTLTVSAYFDLICCGFVAVKCVSDVLLEGRACVASTIALFQFIVLYGKQRRIIKSSDWRWAGVLFSFAKMTGFYYKVSSLNCLYVMCACLSVLDGAICDVCLLVCTGWCNMFQVFMSNSAYLYIDLLIFLPTLVTITMSKPALDLVVEKPPVQLRNSSSSLHTLSHCIHCSSHCIHFSLTLLHYSSHCIHFSLTLSFIYMPYNSFSHLPAPVYLSIWTHLVTLWSLCAHSWSLVWSAVLVCSHCAFAVGEFDH